MERRGTGKRLTDGQRVEIIKLFDSGAAVTEADIARRYGVSRSAIWRLRRSSSHIMERYQEGDIESRDERRRGSLGSGSSSSRAQTQFVAEAASASAIRSAAANSDAEETKQITVNVESLAAMTPGMTTGIQMTTNNGSAAVGGGINSTGGGMMLGMVNQGAGAHVGGGVFVGSGVAINSAAAQVTREKLKTTTSVGASGAGAVSDARASSSSTPSSSPTTTGEVELIPGAVAVAATLSGPEPTLPLIYMSAKGIGSLQSPGVMNWERVNGYDDANHFLIVNDGISIVNEGTYQINIDLEHSQPRQNYKFVFKVWNGKKLIGQCGCPLRTKKEISFSTAEMRCKLQAHARIRVEFLAAGYAFHESRIVIRLVQ